MKIEMRGDMLVIEVDCGPEAREKASDSKSGKTRMLASTHGFSKFGDVAVSLNVTIPKMVEPSANDHGMDSK